MLLYHKLIRQGSPNMTKSTRLQSITAIDCEGNLSVSSFYFPRVRNYYLPSLRRSFNPAIAGLWSFESLLVAKFAENAFQGSRSPGAR